MKKLLSILVIAWMLLPQAVSAAVSFDLGDNAQIKLGGLLQIQNVWNQSASVKSVGVKRARIKVGYDYQKLFSLLVQTDLGLSAGGVQGKDARVIDAYVVIKLNKLAHIYNGMHLAPSSRENLVLPNGFMTGVYPSISFKSLGWTGKVASTFNTGTFTNGSAGFAIDSLVREQGITLFGSDSVNPDFHFKYYLGAYNGSKFYADSGERIIGRVQANFFDPEPGYYNLQTYLGAKKTIAVGLSYDMQPNVATSLTTPTDYKYTSIDVFTEYHIGYGSLTAELAYNKLDLGGNLKAAEGNGIYFQAGYFFEEYNVQPWICYEQWDAETDSGSCKVIRVGGTYFIKGNDLSLKVGVEQFTPEGGSKINTAMGGIYASF